LPLGVVISGEDSASISRYSYIQKKIQLIKDTISTLWLHFKQTTKDGYSVGLTVSYNTSITSTPPQV